MEYARRFNWLSAGRRWRKTTLAMSIVVEASSTGGTYLWGAPTFDQVRIGFNETKRALGGYGDFNQGRMTVTLPGGGMIIFRSLDNPDNARGHTADGVVVDEAGFIKPAAWYEILRPMLIDTGGWGWLIGTPDGRNFFWQEWVKASDYDDAIAWQVPTLGVKITPEGLVRDPHPLENPDISFDEIKQLYRTMPERVFRQEILAEFMESGGGVFRRVMEAAVAPPQDKALFQHDYLMGVDWGRSNDFTVITVIDTTTNELVAMDRFTNIDYAIQVNRLKAIAAKFKPVQIIAEMNSMGGPLVEQLQLDGLPVKGFMTTSASKEEAIRALEGAFERGEIHIINDPVLIGELQAYEQEQLPAGKFRFNAPPGMHDDCVISLAIAWHSIATSFFMWPLDEDE
jgi:phage FluMu gp28-like protein